MGAVAEGVDGRVDGFRVAAHGNPDQGLNRCYRAGAGVERYAQRFSVHGCNVVPVMAEGGAKAVAVILQFGDNLPGCAGQAYTTPETTRTVIWVGWKICDTALV